METNDYIRSCPIARELRPRGVNKRAMASKDRERREVTIGTQTVSVVEGMIVDSWVESSPPVEAGVRVDLQLAPRGHPEVPVIGEADASVISDRLWLEDLSENLCHGSPVRALG